jgi:hypothetical protein
VCRRENTKADSSSKRPQKGSSKKKWIDLLIPNCFEIN